LSRLLSLQSNCPSSNALTYCELDLSVEAISEIEVSGSRFDGLLRTYLTRLKVGYFLRMEIGFDCVTECVALYVRISNVKGSRKNK
jgi:hypothetical protein